MDLKPDLRSENKNVCVMFLDIRNFTGFAEKRSLGHVEVRGREQAIQIYQVA